MISLSSMRKTLEQKKGKRKFIKDRLKASKKMAKKLKEDIKHHEEAQEIIQAVAQATQQQLEYHISELSSLALQSIFEDPYRLRLEFNLRRNKSEADLSFEREDGERIHPLSASGGGVVDVAAYALRVSLWSLVRTRATIILDEPFRFLSRDLQEKGSQMVKEISEKLNVQFIIVTHQRKMVEAADKVFEIRQEEGISKVEEVE